MVYDSKTGKVKRIDTVVLSTQHDPSIGYEELKNAVIEHIIKPVLPSGNADRRNQIPDQPDRPLRYRRSTRRLRFDRRKIIVDTYGGAAPHGGGAFSGKDPSKVDRSAAYACRYVAKKNIVAAGLATHAKSKFPTPSALPNRLRFPSTLSAPAKSTKKTGALVREHFDLRPKGIVQMLDLLRPIYSKSAAYGHFGREEPEFTRSAPTKQPH